MTQDRLFDRWRRLAPRQQTRLAASALSKPERTRRRLLGHALKLFEEQGYTATSPADIAAAAGVSRATFFVYFSTKAAILAEISRVLAGHWARSALAEEQLPEQRLLSLFEFILRETDLGALQTAVLRDFIETYGDDFSAGEGTGTLHFYMAGILTDMTEAEGWDIPWSKGSLAHFFLSSLARLREDLGHMEPGPAARLIADVLLTGIRSTQQRQGVTRSAASTT